MSNGPHRKRIRHIEGLGHLHELTFSCYRRKPLLTNDPWRRILARSINDACNDEGFGLVAFVFMPEHVHLPVKRHLCARADQWKWSSARFYLNDEIDPELPQLTRPDPMWFETSGIQVEHR